MFNFPNVNELDNLETIAAMEDAREYWRFLWHLRKLWTSFGERAGMLTSVYKPFKSEKKLSETLMMIDDISEVKIATIREQLELTDAWISEAQAKLGVQVFFASALEMAAEMDKPNLDELT